LVNIARKSNPKRTKSSSPREEDDDEKSSAGDHHINAQALETRVVYLERNVTRIAALEREVQSLKQELVAFKELAAAQNLLSLAPVNKKRVAVDEPIKEKDSNSKVAEKDEILSLLPPPKKVTRLTSVDSAFELKDFPFEDTSSLGSVSMKDLMRELQYGIFGDFEEFKANSSIAVPTTPVNETESLCKEDKEDYFKIPSGFVLQPGVTMSLLKATFNVIVKMCCPSQGQSAAIGPLKKMCEDHPHPSSLPPVETCEATRELLPILREHVEEEATDLALMRAARQVYEVYYYCVMKKLQEKGPQVACKMPQNAASHCT